MEIQELKEFIDQSIKEAHLTGLQSGKKETSNLADFILKKIDLSIEASVNKYVNGKINGISKKLDDYIITDDKWKEEAKSVIDMGKNIQGFSKVSLYLLGFISAIIGAVMGVLYFFKLK